MRHAKAEPFASTDHARVLTERGRRNAADAGAWLAERGLMPDLALVSTAARTRETWDELAAASGAQADVSYDEALYHGGVEALIEAIQLLPDDAGTVIVVGHNPAAAYLAHLLDDGEGDEESTSGMLRGFPTSALVAFDIDVPWAEIGAESGRVVAFHAP